MPHNQNEKIWECGSKYQHSPPNLAGDEDPWQTFFDSLINKDKIRCSAWKDEVQNLLLFAGLFSAVVTAFLVESYKLLQEDQEEKVVLLLTKIALRFDAIPNDNTFSSKASFSPSKLAVLINTLWFLSLIMNLATVLFGTTSLQWLREHQQYGDPLTTQEAVAVFHMRAEALEKWLVPRVFSALPLLLQTALLLFLAGLICFSLVISKNTTIPITLAVAVGLIVFLGIATTILPTIQAFWVSDPRLRSNTTVPSPCPYKSPQSYLFRRLSTQIQPLFSFLLAICHGIRYLFFFKIYFIIHQVFQLKSEPSRNPFATLPSTFIFGSWSQRSWLQLDRAWLMIRDTHFEVTNPKFIGPQQMGQIRTGFIVYDKVRALSASLKRREQTEQFIGVIYHCFYNIVTSILHSTFKQEYKIKCLRESFADLLPVDPDGRRHAISSILEAPSVYMLADEVMVMFLNLPGMRLKNQRTQKLTIIGVHYFELYTRILGNLYRKPQMLKQPGVNLGTRFFEEYCEEIIDEDLDQVSPGHFSVLSRQILRIVERFFQSLQKHPMGDADMLRTYYSNQDLFEFLHLASVITWHASTGKEGGDLSSIQSLFRAVSSNLTVPTQSSDSISFPFCASAIFVNYLSPLCGISQSPRIRPEVTYLIRRLLTDLEGYEKKVSRSRLGAFYSKLRLTKEGNGPEEGPLFLQTRVNGVRIVLMNRPKAWMEPYTDSLVPTEEDEQNYQKEYSQIMSGSPTRLGHGNWAVQPSRSAGVPASPSPSRTTDPRSDAREFKVEVV